MRLLTNFALLSSLCMVATSGQAETIVDLLTEVPNTIRLYGSVSGASFGSGNGSVATGDFNGDGAADLIVGSQFSRGIDGATAAGAIAIHYGNESLASSRIDLTSCPDCSFIYGNAAYHRIGFSVAAGDVNGDGFDDVVVGIPSGEVLGATRAGRVGIVFGREDAQGSSWKISDPTGDLSTAWIVGTIPYQKVGWAVATGDVNSDGFADVVVGSLREDNNLLVGRGEAFVVFGHADMPGDVSVLGAGKGVGDFLRIQGDRPLAPGSNGDQLGASVAAGDVNGDGFDDVIAGAPRGDGPSDQTPDCGEVVVVYGGPNLSGQSIDLASPPGTYGETRIYGDDPFDIAGHSVTTGDVNGDGYHEILIGVPFADYYPIDPLVDGIGRAVGGAIVLFGKAELSGATISLDTDGLISSASETRLVGYRHASPLSPRSPSDGGLTGWSVATGDLDGDGRDELMTGSPYGSPIPLPQSTTRRQAAGIVHTISSESLVQGHVLNLNQGVASLQIWGENNLHRLGQSIAAGDLNLDGAADLAMVAPQGETPFDTLLPQEGAAYAMLSELSEPVANRSTRFRPANPPRKSLGTALRTAIDFVFAGNPTSVTGTLFRFAPSGLVADKVEEVLPVHWLLESDDDDFSANAIFRYLNSELGGRDESRLAVYHSPTGGPGTWARAGGVQIKHPGRNQIEVLGLNHFAYFALVIEAAAEPSSVLKLF